MMVFRIVAIASSLLALVRASGGVHPVPTSAGFSVNLNFRKFFLDVLLGGDFASVKYQGPPQPTLVLGAGLPRTGTCSLKMALTMLGLKCYHMTVAHETQGHLEMWRQYLATHSLTLNDVLDGLATAGFNATVDAPSAFHYNEQLERYPLAKVILTLRSEDEEEAAQAWANSASSTILRIPHMSREVPYRWLGVIQRYTQLNDVMYETAKLPHHLEDHHLLPAFYQTWNQEVMQSIPSDNLLILRAKDGWEPLCEFLSPVSDIVRQSCQAVIEAGIPYPQANDRIKFQAAMSVFSFFTQLFKALPYIVLFIAVGEVVMRWQRRRRRAGPGRPCNASATKDKTH